MPATFPQPAVLRHVQLAADITDASGDSDLYLPAGTEVKLLSDEGDYFIAETLDGKVSFPVEASDFTEMTTI